VSPSKELQRLEAEAHYYRDRVSLLRAKLYRGGSASSRRLLELERVRDRAEQRLRAQRARESR
jgi:hypothetical protein